VSSHLDSGLPAREARSGSQPPARRRRRWFVIGAPVPLRAYIGIAAFGFVLFIVAWSIARWANLAPQVLFPGPVDVLAKLVKLGRDGTLWGDILASVYRILVGFLIATAVAIPVGVLIGTYSVAEAFIEPFVDFVRYMPPVGFVPLTIVWLGVDDTQKFAIVFIGTFFQEVLLVMDNTKRVPMELVNIGRTLGLRDRSVLFRIVLPSAAPQIWDTLRISLGWAWTWVVLAEALAATSGLGYRIQVSIRFNAIDTIIGYLIVLGLLGLLTDQSMKAIGRGVFRWAER
jgi:NitT/TauT family transport system permease protein